MDKEPCEYCGRENSTDHETCPGCGAPVQWECETWGTVVADLWLKGYLHPGMNLGLLGDYLEIHNGTDEGECEREPGLLARLFRK